MIASRQKLALVAVLVGSISLRVAVALVYPAASVYQITSCASAPIEIPERKIFFDWCFQMSYDLPTTLAQFYNAPIWKNIFQSRNVRSLGGENYNNTTSIDYAKYGVAPAHETNVHPSDFTAGELYHSLENLLVRYDFHETCLLRSVCEIALHPFAADQTNLLTEILTFLLSPSIHQAFGRDEHLYKSVYEAAETQGKMGLNCAELYSDCQLDLLTALTKIITH